MQEVKRAEPEKKAAGAGTLRSVEQPGTDTGRGQEPEVGGINAAENFAMPWPGTRFAAR